MDAPGGTYLQPNSAITGRRIQERGILPGTTARPPRPQPPPRQAHVLVGFGSTQKVFRRGIQGRPLGARPKIESTIKDILNEGSEGELDTCSLNP